tara:strand:+ start:70728 stop:72932 length:2205 start_codon:yes stop_codon:yes gene_type:complete
MMLANVGSGACIFLTFLPNIPDGFWLWLALMAIVSGLAILNAWRSRADSFDSASPRRAHIETLNAIALAALWSSMILLWFPGASPSQQTTIATLITGMMGAGAFFLSPMPYASIGHVLVYSLSALCALWLSGVTGYIGIALLICLYSPMVLIGSLLAWRKSTDLLAAQAQSARQEEMLTVLLHDFERNAGDALWETSTDGMLNHISSRLKELLVLAHEEQTTHTFHQILCARCPGHIEQLAPLMANGNPFRDLSLTMQGSVGTRHLLMTGKCLYSSSDVFLGWRGVLSDVTDKVASEQKLRLLAHSDSLTGLANRFHLHETLRGLLKRRQPLALFSIDLDRFKSVNDNYGHSVGDAILQVVAKRMQSCVPQNALIARLGGDEFAIVLWSEEGVQNTAALAQKVIKTLAGPITLSGRQFRIGASVGITVRTETVIELDDLLVQADIAMYAAKEGGRGRWAEYSTRLGQIIRRRMLLEQGLRTAIENEEISLHWQPKVDLHSWQITGAEALMRWKHPEMGDISPMEFIPVAEQCGLIDKLGSWALREACRVGTRELTGLTVAVNVSAVQLQFGGFVEALKEVLRSSGIEPHKLELELTESVFIEDADKAVTILNAIRSTGVRLALDDFGTGYSSLSYLRRFPFDTLKIDRSFVTELLTKADARAIVKMITDLANELGKRTVCEGVETLEQLQIVCAANCHEIQGYLISPPCPLESFPRTLDPNLNPLLLAKCSDKS